MSNKPEDIKRDIEATREELSRDVDALSEKVSPARALERRVERARGAVGGLKERVMGVTATTGDTQGSGLSGAPDKVAAAASTVADTATAAPEVARSQTRGNPLAAGLIAFGIGWLVSSLLPATQREKDVSVVVKEKASEHSDAVKQPLAEAANEMKDRLREPAQQAAESVRSTAQDAAANVQDEARAATQDVKNEAKQAKQAVGDGTASSPSTDVRGTTAEARQPS